MRWLRWVGLGLLMVVVLALAGFTIWAYTPLGPAPEALAALQSDAKVHVDQQPWLIFKPVGREPTNGFIFYPGGRVDPRSYAVTARALAEQGNLVVIVPMPFNLAFFGSSRAQQVQAAFPQIQHWVIGGHSLGGVAAAMYAHSKPNSIDGLVLWASYPTSGDSLADSALPVLSIYGTEDMGRAQIEASKPLLPEATRWVVIQGGNHAQFGDYGPQPGDNPATVSRADQQAQAVQATAEFIKEKGVSREGHFTFASP